jgi:hypothetical protein
MLQIQFTIFSLLSCACYYSLIASVSDCITDISIVCALLFILTSSIMDLFVTCFSHGARYWYFSGSPSWCLRTCKPIVPCMLCTDEHNLQLFLLPTEMWALAVSYRLPAGLPWTVLLVGFYSVWLGSGTLFLVSISKNSFPGWL